MFRLNRGRIIGILLTTFIVYFLFLSSANSNSDFRRRTEEGLSRRHGVLQGDLSDEAFREQTNQKLNDILAAREGNKEQEPLQVTEEEEKKKEEKKPVRVVDVNKKEDVNDGKGRKASPKEVGKKGEKSGDSKQETLKKFGDDDGDDQVKKIKESADPAKDIVRAKLQEYMKKPMIIFSKSYCPHSKRAKHLLLNLYKITPTPLVIELDQLTEHLPLPKPKPKRPRHEDDDDMETEPEPQPQTLGQKLQELLAEVTGRRTVPNIVVGTTSIGGNDLIWEMHEMGTLSARIRELGGKRITSVEVLDPEEDSEHTGHGSH